MHSTMMLSAVSILLANAPTVSYTPLSEEAARLGRLTAYETTPASTHQLALGDLVLTATVPAACRAYDCVPVRYRLAGVPGERRVAVEATAFEDVDRRRGRDLYDLAVPGRMQVEMEYLGSQTGIFEPTRVSRLTRNSRHETFPPYRLQPFVRSATVERGNFLWFKFRVTNTGDTILDPEGFGAWMTRLLVYRLHEDGRRELAGQAINNVHRVLEYVYPGESIEHWSDVWFPGHAPEVTRTLSPGRYVLQYDLLYRAHHEFNWIVNMWQGKPWVGIDVPIEVVDTVPAGPTVEPTAALRAYEPPDADRMPGYFERFEEFMTAFDVLTGEPADPAAERTLYIQVAPWTTHVVLKLITNRPGEIRTVAVPLEVDTSGLELVENPDNPFAFVRKDGRREAWICTQAMPAMRSSHQLGPHPEQHLRERLREMQETGINVIATTGGNWHVGQIYAEQAFVGDIHAETFKHYYDVITREMDMPVLGWGVFPPKTENTLGLGGHYWGRTFDVPVERFATTYSSRPELDVGHPDFPRAYAGCILFNYERWGDQWARTADGDLLVDVEDTWGWLRDDIHMRYFLGPHALRRFRAWVRERYGTIEAANLVWGASYASFDEIDPQKGQNTGGEVYGIALTHVAPEYTNPEHPFHDWSPAVDDWDRFRTELRCDIYDEIQEIVRQRLPEVHINLRTEGACILSPVADWADAPHLRHVRYALRRNALRMDVLERRQTFKYHSDYTTLPYSETELRLLLRGMRRAGIRGNYLPQFDHMRDMLTNDHYGRPWQVHYNLDQPKRALMVHCLTAAYPWLRIMYEEGHCPGVLWEDYGCDGFVTETQKREIRLFRDAVDRATSRSRPATAP